METELGGRLLARTLVPYLQQWAENAGFALLSTLLRDEQVRDLIEKYGDEIATRVVRVGSNGVQRQGRRNGRRRAVYVDHRMDDVDAGNDEEADTLARLHARVQAMEEQQQAVESLLLGLQAKIRPLALALGSCPDCFVGVEGCPTCLGRSSVAHNEPDLELLEAHVVTPLAARGVPLALNKRRVSRNVRQSAEPSTRTRRSS